jgi:uncharacterized protein (DUF1499 family)
MRVFLLLTLVAMLTSFLPLLNGCGGSRKAAQVGLIAGLLRPCPGSPNCVSSAATDDKQRVEPLQLLVAPPEAWETVKQTIPALARTQIVSVTANYIHAECRSAVFGFIDDLELHLQADQQQIAVRSVARLGYYDFGVNRQRVEELRRKLLAAGVAQ